MPAVAREERGARTGVLLQSHSKMGFVKV